MRKHRISAFTLAEMLVAGVVLTLIVFFVTRLVNNAAAVVTIGSKRIDINSEIRPLFDRVTEDLVQMIKRPDVTYGVKTQATQIAGNDVMAFFSSVEGYYPDTDLVAEKRQPQTTVISYRVNRQLQLERMAKSLRFAGISTTPAALIFGTSLTLTNTFPSAWDLSASPTPEPDSRVVAEDVFRFEYYYLISAKPVTGGLVAGKVSTGPWSDLPAVNMADVSAIAVAVATIDPRSRKLVSIGGALPNSNLQQIVNGMADFNGGMTTTTALLAAWQQTLDGFSGNGSPLPPGARAGVRGIRLYQRIIPIN